MIRIEKLSRNDGRDVFEMLKGIDTVENSYTNAYEIFEILKDEYNIWICPNGGDMKNTIFRVGHIGHLSHDDNTTLINALKDMMDKNLL